MTSIRNVSRLDMRDPINRRDRLPAPGALDCRRLAGPDAPRDLMPDEQVVLVALDEHNPSTIANVGDATRRSYDGIRAAVRRLAGRGLVSTFGPSDAAIRLTNPAGRALARALADNLPRCGDNPKE